MKDQTKRLIKNDCCSPDKDSSLLQIGARKEKKLGSKLGVFTAFGSGTTALLAGISGSLCCGFPIVSGIISFFGISTSFLSGLAPFQSLFISLAFASIGYEYGKIHSLKKTELCCNLGLRRWLLRGVSLFLLAILVAPFFSDSNSSFDNSERSKDNKPASCCEKSS